MTSCTRIRFGWTLPELLVAIGIAAVAAAVAFPRIVHLRDVLAVRAAANDADALFTFARQAAIARTSRAVVSIAPDGRLAVTVGDETLQVRDVGGQHDVVVWSSRSQSAYAPTGAGLGGANLTLLLSRGAAAETVVVSRLGRVRR